MDCLNTANTTRLPYRSPVELSVATARMLWPDAGVEGPQVAVLAPVSHVGYALAAAALIHDPVHGVLLLTPDDELPELLAEELRRLNPPGTNQLPPVVVVGPVRQRLITAIETLGYGVLTVTGRSVAAVAANAARLREEVGSSPKVLMLVGLEHSAAGLAAGYYATHSGVPILFSQQDRLPASTTRFLRDHPGRPVYVIAGRRSVSDGVLRQLENLSGAPVTRIAGQNAPATAVAFARFYDPAIGFGWNRTSPSGDAFSFANAAAPELAVAGANLAHRGKHTPLLLIRADSIPDVVADYLYEQKPPLSQPPGPPFLHGYILGCPDDIACGNQARLELALSIDYRQPLPQPE